MAFEEKSHTIIPLNDLINADPNALLSLKAVCVYFLYSFHLFLECDLISINFIHIIQFYLF